MHKAKISPKDDFMFKAIFTRKGNKELLEDLIESIIGRKVKCKNISKEARVGQIIEKYGEPELGSTATPEEGKDINTYKADYYYIMKTDDAKEYNIAMADLIYPASGNTALTTTYWLASPCVDVDFDWVAAYFYVRSVSSDYDDVAGECMFNSGGGSESYTCAVRPVVSLSSDIQMTYSNRVVALSVN